MRALLDACSDAVFVTTVNGVLLDCNETAVSLFGYTPELLCTLRLDELVVGGDPKLDERTISTLRRKDGTHFEGELLRVRGGSSNDEPWYWVVIRDLSDRRRAERALAQMRDSNELFRALSDAAFEAVFMHRDGVIHMANRAAEQYSGVPPGGLHGRRLLDFIAPQSVQLAMAKVASGDDQPYEAHAQRADGSIYPVEVHPRTIPIELSAGTMRVVAMRDMSERRQLEQQLQQSQKMEAIGRLAGGVAHDFNNLLSVMLGATELAASGLPDEHPSRADLDEVILAANRAAELTRSLLTFGRKTVLQPKVIDVVEVLDGMKSLLRRALREDIELRMSLPPHPAWVRADPVQLEQVILNLGINARDAMPTAGQLQISVATVTLDAQFARTHIEVQSGAHVQLTVSDTGLGMDADTCARAFEPFFTTKGGGHGLGLATVFGVIKQSGGTIWIESELGSGTTFTIYLPACAAEHPQVEAAPAPTPSPQVDICASTILVVEDETAVRRVVVELLTRAGYRVLAAADPLAALELIAEQRGAIDLLLTDVVMPHMSGLQLAERVTKDDARIRVVFMSGHAEQIVTRGEFGSSVNFVPKPVDSATLLDTLTRALDS